MSDKSKIPAEVIELSKKLAKGLTIKVDGNVATTEISGNPYKENLPEGLTEENLEAVQKYNSTFYAAATHAFGDTALASLKKAKSVDKVTAEFPLHGKDVFSVGFKREDTFTVPGTGEKGTNYGVISAKLETYEARANRGVIKHIRDELSAKALAAFAE